jgi:hypothetical protein
MNDSRWFFASALAGVLLLGIIFFLFLQHRSNTQTGTPLQTITNESSQTIYPQTKGTSSPYINPNAIPQ